MSKPCKSSTGLGYLFFHLAMCEFQVSLLSNTTPKYLGLSTLDI